MRFLLAVVMLLCLAGPAASQEGAPLADSMADLPAAVGRSVLRFFDQLIPDLGGPATPESEELINAPTIAAVNFVGNVSLSGATLADSMETKAADWKFWLPSPRLDRAALQRDREAIARVYQSEGYYLAEVEVSLEERDNQAFVTFGVKEGPPVRVRDVNITLSGADEDWLGILTAAVRRAGIQKDGIFRVKDYQAAKEALVRHFAENGHPRPLISGRVEVFSRAGQADVFLDLQAGPRLLMGPAVAEGLGRTNPEVIEREVSWARGEQFDIRLLEKSRKRLMDLDIFTSVRLDPRLDDIKDDRVPITIKAVERARHSVAVSLGYGSEDYFRVRLTQQNRSVLGMGEVLSASLQYSNQIQAGVLDYLQPQFLMRDQTLNLRGGLEDRQAVSFKNRRGYGLVTLKRLLAQDLWIQPGFSAELDRPYKIKTFVHPDEAQEYRIFYPTLGVYWDTRDDKLDPNTGTYSYLSAEYSPAWLGSELHYLRLEAHASHYLPVRPWLTLAGRLRGESINPLGDTEFIPAFKRIYAGGDRSVRGYPFQRMGPLDENGYPVGGLSLVEASVEGRFPVWGPLKGVVFLDAGCLSTTTLTFDPAETRFAVGVGLRYNTIIGPLRLDLGYQLNPPSNSDFGTIQYHFSVGQAF